MPQNSSWSLFKGKSSLSVPFCLCVFQPCTASPPCYLTSRVSPGPPREESSWGLESGGFTRTSTDLNPPCGAGNGRQLNQRLWDAITLCVHVWMCVYVCMCSKWFFCLTLMTSKGISTELPFHFLKSLPFQYSKVLAIMPPGFLFWHLLLSGIVDHTGR